MPEIRRENVKKTGRRKNYGGEFLLPLDIKFGQVRVARDPVLDQYVVELIKHGITSYPDLAEFYVQRQQELATVILPPTRFLYIFSAYLWHQITGANPLLSLRAVSCLFSILLMFAAGGFAWRLAGPGLALAVFALMSCAPTQIHMAQHG